jgi:O-antigen/teichoic acid export membrane protein
MFVVIFGLNSLIESIFIAFRDTKFIFIKNSVFSAIKLIVPFLFINLGTYGVFGSIAVSLTVSTAYSLMILIKKFNYSPRFIIDKIVVKKIAWFSFATYINGFLGSLPTMILPLMIVNIIGPKAAAYYYIATMIAGILFIIPQAVTQSFFAEGSHNENNLLEITVKSSKIIALLLIPAIIFTLFFGKYILIAFGKDYSSESLRLLQMLALSGIFMSINSVFSTILLVQHRILNMIIMSILNIIFTLGLTYLWINYGLSGIGAAWIIGQAAVSLVFILLKVTNYLKIADQVNPDYGRIN